MSFPHNPRACSSKLAGGQEKVLFGGRLGQYVYADMDDTVAAALALCKREFGG